MHPIDCMLAMFWKRLNFSKCQEIMTNGVASLRLKYINFLEKRHQRMDGGTNRSFYRDPRMNLKTG